jgi:quinolinate synthase
MGNYVDKNDIAKFGFLNFKIDKGIDIRLEISKLRKEKDAVILAHYYQNDEIQEIADFVGDSLALAQFAEKTNASVILFAGVNFMAETAKILNPGKKVLIPDLWAGCSLADSCRPEEFKSFLKNFPDHMVISYINTSAEIKALSDIICTSSNALKIVESLNREQKIVFAPDRNLGNYINSLSGRKMIIWDGACHVHEEFSVERIMEMKELYPNAKVLAHPECERPVLIMSDFIGSTAALLKFTMKDEGMVYIVATESGILYQMRKENPEKIFIAAPPKDSTCACSDCNYMKLNSMEKIYKALRYEMPELVMNEDLRKKAELPLRRMLDISKELGI